MDKKLLRLLKLVAVILGIIALALIIAPFFTQEPDLRKQLLVDLAFVAAGLVLLAAIGFTMSMLDTKQRRASPPKDQQNTPFTEDSLFSAKVRAMHERAKNGIHIHPEGHVCTKKIRAIDMLTEAVDPDDIVVDCYGDPTRGYKTRFYGSLDGGVNWYELIVPSNPADRKALLMVAFNLASVHDYASLLRHKAMMRDLEGKGISNEELAISLNATPSSSRQQEVEAKPLDAPKDPA